MRRLLEPLARCYFVGSIRIRKGAHLILGYWQKSRVPGRLVLADRMEPAIAKRFRKLLARDDVRVIAQTDDIAAVYRSADIFAFPSLEEGGPQVTNKAAACQLPPSPVGAARIMREGTTGFVIHPFDDAGWIEAIRMLSASPALREEMGRVAFEAAKEFSWEQVGLNRVRGLSDVAAKQVVHHGER